MSVEEMLKSIEIFTKYEIKKYVFFYPCIDENGSPYIEGPAIPNTLIKEEDSATLKEMGWIDEYLMESNWGFPLRSCVGGE
jgi:hypothetical protein